jgi:hypothetical protein
MLRIEALYDGFDPCGRRGTCSGHLGRGPLGEGRQQDPTARIGTVYDMMRDAMGKRVDFA